MSVGQKLTMLKIRSTSVTFLSLCNLEAAPEEAIQFRRLIKRSNESLRPYLFGKIEFWNFQGPTAEIPVPKKSPHLIGLTTQAAADACLTTENERIICNLNFTFRAVNIRYSFTLVLSQSTLQGLYVCTLHCPVGLPCLINLKKKGQILENQVNRKLKNHS